LDKYAHPSPEENACLMTIASDTRLFRYLVVD